MASNNKQTSVRNRRMNPPRPALSNRGTVYRKAVGKPELQANFPAPRPRLPLPAGSSFLNSGDGLRSLEVKAKALCNGTPKKAAEDRKTLDEAIRQHAMAGLPPVRSAHLTGSRRRASARPPVDEKRYRNS
jgi:hypothetical protein